MLQKASAQQADVFFCDGNCCCSKPVETTCTPYSFPVSQNITDARAIVIKISAIKVSNTCRSILSALFSFLFIKGNSWCLTTSSIAASTMATR